MNMPGFTAEKALNEKGSYSHAIASVHAGFRTSHVGIIATQRVTPQTFGGHFCYWRCYPASGCEYVCQYLPF